MVPFTFLASFNNCQIQDVGHNNPHVPNHDITNNQYFRKQAPVYEQDWNDFVYDCEDPYLTTYEQDWDDFVYDGEDPSLIQEAAEETQWFTQETDGEYQQKLSDTAQNIGAILSGLARIVSSDIKNIYFSLPDLRGTTLSDIKTASYQTSENFKIFIYKNIKRGWLSTEPGRKTLDQYTAENYPRVREIIDELYEKTSESMPKDFDEAGELTAKKCNELKETFNGYINQAWEYICENHPELVERTLDGIETFKEKIGYEQMYSWEEVYNWLVDIVNCIIEAIKGIADQTCEFYSYFSENYIPTISFEKTQRYDDYKNTAEKLEEILTLLKETKINKPLTYYEDIGPIMENLKKNIEELEK